MTPSISTGSGGLPKIKSPTSSPQKSDGAKQPALNNNQVHSYHKLFWRINLTLEFNIFYHQDRNLYEVAAYSSEKDLEYDTLYLNEKPIMDMMNTDSVNTEVDKLKVKMSKNRFAQMPTAAEMIELGKKSLFNKFVESHLNPEGERSLIISNLPGEDLDMDAIIFKQPIMEQDEGITDVEEDTSASDEENKSAATGHVATVRELKKSASTGMGKTTVVRRHRSSIHDFNKSLNILKKDSKSLKMANKMTENLLSLSEQSVDAFKNALQFNAGSSKRYDKTTPLGLFRWAVHRIILQQYVEAVRLRMEALSEEKKVERKPLRINGTFPAPGSTDMQGQQAQILSLAGRFSQANSEMKNLSETLSRENSPRINPKKGAIAHSVSLPSL